MVCITNSTIAHLLSLWLTSLFLMSLPYSFSPIVLPSLFKLGTNIVISQVMYVYLIKCYLKTGHVVDPYPHWYYII